MNKEKTPRLAVLVCLFAIFLTSVALSYINIQHPLDEHASDEHAYIGLANKYVYLQNKEPYIFPWQPQGTGLLSYSLGVVSKVSTVPIEAVFRIAHIVTLFLIVISSFRLGSVLGLRTGPLLIFTALFALFPSTGTWQGPAGMTPSTLAFIPILNILASLITRSWRSLAVWSVILFLVHWWFLIPMAVFIVVYYAYHRIRYPIIFFSMLAALGFAAFFIQPFVRSLSPLLASLLESPRALFETRQFYGNTNYFEFLTSHIVYLLPLVLPALVYFFIQITRTKDDRRDIPLALEFGSLLLITGALLFVSGGQVLLSRSIVLFFAGIFILVVHYLSFMKERQTYVLLPFITLFLITGTVQASQTNAQQFFSQISMTRSERALIEHLKTTGDLQKKLILSDYSTMILLPSYLDSPINVLLDSTLPGYIGLDPKKLMEFINTPDFSKKDAAYLDMLQSQTKSDELDIFISDRTRVYTETFKASGNAIGYRGVPHDFTSYPPAAIETAVADGPFRLIERFEDPSDSSFAELYRYIPPRR